MTPQIMYYNIHIAYSVEREGVLLYILQPDLPEQVIPRALFRQNRDIVTQQDLKEWVKYRIPPKNRQDIKEILKELNLKKYDPITYALATGASVIGDGWWIKTAPDQTYETHNFRGKLGYPEKTLEDFTN